MKLDVTQQIRELDGTLMVTGKQQCPACGQVMGDVEPMTVRLAATNALAAVYRDEKDLPGSEKMIRFHLALRIMDEDEPEIKAEAIALIKAMVAKMYGPVVVGRVWGIIDPVEAANNGDSNSPKA